ncbi:MAG: hypothetical protein Q8P81_04445 [Nanoarchaeota archaeon]|nr:hypothetical protein [Nanoarchaeota archaeon]
MKIDKYKLSLEILDYFNKQDRPILRANVIGLEYQEGNFGLHHNRTLSNEERSMLDLVLKELQEKRLVQPVYRDIISRGEDLQITDKGRRALEKKVLDELDELLLGLNPETNLINMRYGAYDAVLDAQTDWQRQAAASLVELIDHTLRIIAPNEKIVSKKWYKPEATSKTGVTRKQRVQYFLEEKNGARSTDTEKVVNRSWELIEACRGKLEGIKHMSDDRNEIEQLIKLVEDALIYLLKR